MIGRREIAAGVAVMVAFIIAAVVLGSAWQNHSDEQQAAQDARQARAAAHRLAVEGYRQDIKRWHELQSGCSRSKVDRTAIAAALRAQATYLNQVLDAASVKADVKRAARVAQATFSRSASGLESRSGKNLRCGDVYPKPLAPSGVTPLP
jgi:type II secretory pathway pseudopilin PulG